MLDSSDTGTSTELVYILGGKAQEIVTLEQGDVAAVLPLTPHAFAAAPGHTADLPIIVAPASSAPGTSACSTASAGARPPSRNC
ncbi:cupin domain-containing protein [Nonomuraea endophytica]|uniref:cupin domain-containing protein n=1 Tax=Nonomuraea endophytica TaxID=714136 RepID=UPI0037CA9F95